MGNLDERQSIVDEGLQQAWIQVRGLDDLGQVFPLAAALVEEQGLTGNSFQKGLHERLLRPMHTKWTCTRSRIRE